MSVSCRGLCAICFRACPLSRRGTCRVRVYLYFKEQEQTHKYVYNVYKKHSKDTDTDATRSPSGQAPQMAAAPAPHHLARADDIQCIGDDGDAPCSKWSDVFKENCLRN